MRRISNGIPPDVSENGDSSEAIRNRNDIVTSMDNMRLRLENELVAELRKLDLSANEAKVLLYLMSNGSSTASDIARYTKIQRTDAYDYISMLLSKGIIFSTFSNPQKYYSMPYDEVVDQLIQAKSTALREVSQKKLYCKSKLEQISRCAIRENVDDTYQALAGESVIIAKASKLLSGPIGKVAIFLTDRMLTKFYHHGIIEQLSAISKSGGNVRIKTRNTEWIKLDADTVDLNWERINDPTPASFLIVNDDIVLFIMDQRGAKNKEMAGLYSNTESVVSTVLHLFDTIA